MHTHGQSTAATGGGAAGSEGTHTASREAFQEVVRQIFRGWKGHFLHLFFEKEQSSLEVHAPLFGLFKNFVRQCEADTRNDGEFVREAKEKLDEALLLLLSDPITLHGQRLNNIQRLIDYTIRRHFLVGDEFKQKVLEFWNLPDLQSKELDAFEEELETFFNNSGLKVSGYLPKGSFGVFLRMPAFMTDLVLFIIKRNAAVRKQLEDLGFRSFAPLHLDDAGTMPLGAAEWQAVAGGEGAAMEEAAPHVPCGHICGYNIGDRPAWVPADGWGTITPQHRELVDSMSAEFRQRTAASDASDEEDRDHAAHQPFEGAANPFAEGAEPRAGAVVGKEEGRAAIQGAVEVLRRRLEACRDGSAPLDAQLRALVLPSSTQAKAASRSGLRSASGGKGSGTRGGGSSRGGGERELIERVLEELHDFRDEGGACTSDWVLKVSPPSPAFDPIRASSSGRAPCMGAVLPCRFMRSRASVHECTRLSPSLYRPQHHRP